MEIACRVTSNEAVAEMQNSKLNAKLHRNERQQAEEDASSNMPIGAYLNIPEGAKATTTIESKTNFMRAAPLDSIVTGECTPLHVGRRTSVWQTTLRNEEHKTIAVVTQTQMVL